MKYCPNCGQKLPAKSRFCPHCGQPAKGSAPPSKPPPQPQKKEPPITGSTIGKVFAGIFAGTIFASLWHRFFGSAPAASAASAKETIIEREDHYWNEMRGHYGYDPSRSGEDDDSTADFLPPDWDDNEDDYRSDDEEFSYEDDSDDRGEDYSDTDWNDAEQDDDGYDEDYWNEEEEN